MNYYLKLSRVRIRITVVCGELDPDQIRFFFDGRIRVESTRIHGHLIMNNENRKDEKLSL